SALELGARLLGQDNADTSPPPAITRAVSRLLMEATRLPDLEVRQRAWTLAQALATPSAPKETTAACREFIRTCLKDQEPEQPPRASRAASQAGIDLLEEVAGLLRDPVAEVRRAALLAVGSAPEVLATDDLLHWLHDPDANVRRVCEKALQGRGL